MKKILRKSIASVVSAVLCLTAFVGCLTVNAEIGNGSIKVGSMTANKGESIVIPVTVTADAESQGVAIALFDLTYNTSLLEITDIRASALKDNAVDQQLNYYVDYRPDNENASKIGIIKGENTEEGTARIMAVVRDESSIAVKTMTVYLYFTVAANAEDGASTDITLSNIQASNNGTVIKDVDKGILYANDEQRINMTAEKVGKVTVNSAHTHNWNKSELTTMPTADYEGKVVKGVITYTCADCTGIKAEPFKLTADSTITTRTETNKTYVDVDTVEVAYAGKISNSVFTAIQDNGCTVTEVGMLFTRDGTVPDFTDSNPPKVFTNTDANLSIGQITAVSPTISYKFTGLSFVQMGQTLTYRIYVKFTRNGQDCYCFGAPYSKVFINEIRNNTEPQYKALTNLYDSRSSATNISQYYAGTKMEDGTDSRIYTSSRRPVFDMTQVSIQYGAQFDKTIFSGIKDAGGNVVEIGMLFRTDGKVPTYNNVSKPGYTFDNMAAIISGNFSPTLYFCYKGLSFEQMGQTLVYRGYVKYEDSQGEHYLYGDAFSFRYIDILSVLAGENTFANALLDYYDTYVPKINIE